MRANFSQVSSAATGQVRVRRAAADLDLAPAGFAAQGQEHAVVEEFRPARSFEQVLGAHDEAGDFRAAQAAGEAEQEDRPVAQVP